MNWEGEEKRKSNDKTLQAIELKLELLIHQIKNDYIKTQEYHESINKILDQHTAIIYGEDGHITRIDRLEQFKEHQEKNILIIYSTAIGLFLKLIWDFINHKT